MTRSTDQARTDPRLTLSVPGVREFQRRYEAAVPDLPADQVAALLQRAAAWSEMEALIEASAPHGFLFYSQNDAHPLMHAAGNPADCLWYLMGNHVLAEQMFRYDPRVMLYAPLRTVIWEDPTGGAWFSLEQPSTQFASFDIPELTAVGIELDRKLAALLDALDLDAPSELFEREPDPPPLTHTETTTCPSINAQHPTGCSPKR